jgi:hypothetical protein
MLKTRPMSVVQVWKTPWSSGGTPSISFITASGSGLAKSSMTSHSSARFPAGSEGLAHQAAQVVLVVSPVVVS